MLVPILVVAYILLPTETQANLSLTRFDVYKTLCPQQMLVHKGGQIKNGGGGAEMSHLQNCSVKIFKSTAGILQKNRNN